MQQRIFAGLVARLKEYYQNKYIIYIIMKYQCFKFEKPRQAINHLPKYAKQFRQTIFTFVFIHQVAFYVIHMAVSLYNRVMWLSGCFRKVIF